MQLVVAGKAHPADEGGKELIRLVLEHAGGDAAGGRVVFLPDYDIALARLIAWGVDLWLNTPRRPQEACGTSGMKAALNGALNLSTLDGWWAEAYTPEIGWAFGADDLADDEAQDRADAEALYRVLEQEVVPAFADRRGLARPRGRLARAGGRPLRRRPHGARVHGAALPAGARAADTVLTAPAASAATVVPAQGPYSFELSTERFRAFGPDLANRWHEGAVYRIVGEREVRIGPAAGGIDVEPLDDETEAGRPGGRRPAFRARAASTQPRPRMRCSPSWSRACTASGRRCRRTRGRRSSPRSRHSRSRSAPPSRSATG